MTDKRTKMGSQAPRDAISVNDAWKRYGKSDKGTQVLAGLTLTVQEGSIYTLLGSSGCGKTTLLSCIVGMTKLDKGECKIFGRKPGSKGCGVPGRKVGYMPQEIALYGEFTIREAMLYFGKINGMASAHIEARMDFLIKFLNLPPCERAIRSLSGGQQRRVSFAVALLHQPKILILDEPTVGVDPLLRKSIWAHLTGLVESGKTTVVITTHYIEEASEAHRIGLMRNGRLLAEDAPRRLLEEFECAKLEDVFFKLSVMDTNCEEYGSMRSPSQTSLSKPKAIDAENGSTSTRASLEADTSNNSDSSTAVAVCNERSNQPRSSVSSIPSPTTPGFNRSIEHLVDGTTVNDGKSKGKSKEKKTKRQLFPKTIPNVWKHKSEKEVNLDDSYSDLDDDQDCWTKWMAVWNIMVALLLKNFLCMWRNISFVLFIFLLPALQAILFCVAIGGEPSRLKLGFVNKEVSNYSHCNVLPGCSLTNMSCNFIKTIPNDTITIQPFSNEEDALKQVKLGNMWGYVVIPANFSTLMIRNGVSRPGKAKEVVPYEESFQGTHITVHLDMTNQQVSYALQQALAMSFQKFSSNLLFDCGMHETIEMPPSSFAKAIYGGIKSSFREFMAPGIILSIIFFMSVALTGSAFITERKEGMLNRTLVSGVTTGEIITAHLLTQYVVMVGQTVLVLAVMIWVFNVQIEGSIPASVFLTLFQGTCGMAFGFLISVICTDERNAIQISLGSFYPNLLLSGVFWPLESIPIYLRQVAMFLPQTMACDAMRSIFSRGWCFFHPKVWPGFAISVGWSAVFWILALFLARMKKKMHGSASFLSS